MKKINRLAALILTLSLLLATISGCASNTPTSSAPVSTEQSSSTEVSTEAPDSESPTKTAEWQPFDENGNMIRTDRDATGENGVVASSNYEVSKIALNILQNGGNAIDAGVAAGFALGVAEPFTSGIGGGGFMVIRFAETGETKFIDFREIAPKNASPAMWNVDQDGKVEGNQKQEGGKASGVPGDVAGLLYALDTYGSMDRKAIIQPSIDLANNGFVISPTMANAIKDSVEGALKYKEFGELYLNDGLPYSPGDTFKNPDLAKTLGMIAEKGVDGFYKGEVAQAIVDTVNKYDGVFTMEDLGSYKPIVRDTITGTYRGYEIITPPPPSSGGAHLIQILNILENYDMASMQVGSTEYFHAFSEAFKIAFADRGKYMGDTDFVEVPVGGLISKDYAKELYQTIDPKAAKEFAFGDPWQYEHEDTTHISIADKDGNVIAITKTINYFFGSKVAVGGYGFMMNNEMDDFVTGEGSANSVEPGKKPLSSMTPTIILKDGKPFMTIGSPGGVRIFPTLAQVISRVIDHQMDIQAAIDSPRIFNNTANKLNYEKPIDPKTLEELVAMGHEVVEKGEWDLFFGGVQGIVYMPDGTIRGGADPRRDGKALGF